jgi:hypothetical protein
LSYNFPHPADPVSAGNQEPSRGFSVRLAPEKTINKEWHGVTIPLRPHHKNMNRAGSRGVGMEAEMPIAKIETL